jgi:hypothetical protein
MANLLSTAITGTTTTSDSVVIGGTFANNSHSSVSSTRLMFGGGDSPNNYSIGTSLNNYGGNYTKLDLRWHTGIRMGAQPIYGGIRFFSDETLATRIMSIGETDANIRIDNNLYIGGAGGWITDLLAAKQNASTAITTSNIAGQTVAFANQLTVVGAGATIIDANTFQTGILSNYYGTAAISNIPEQGYGSLYNFGGYDNTTLSLQLFSVINHNTNTPTRELYFRMGNNLGFANDWRTIVDSKNIGSQSVSYATTAGSAPNAGNLNTSYGVSTGFGNGLKFWGGSDLYKIHMGNSAEYHYGPVTDYSIKTNIDSVGATRGFTWGESGVTPIAALNVGNGNMQIAGTFTAANFSGSSSGTNTGDQTNISGNSATTSQIVFSDLKINFPSGVGGGHSFSSNHYSMGLDSGNGGWDGPHYRDVIIGYHTGIRIGANYSGVRFYDNSPTTDANNDGNGDGAEKLLMTVGGYVGTANHTDVVVNNNLFANVSMRAPIFYDSQDTAYYVDPNGNSYLSTLRVANASSGVSLHVGLGSTHGVLTDDNERKYLVVSASYYPHMALVAATANNTTHGPVFSFVGTEGTTARQWNLGTSNQDPFFFSIGYNSFGSPNPHYGVGDAWSGDDANHARLIIDRSGNTKIRGMLYVNGTSGGISTGSAVIHSSNIGSQSVSVARQLLSPNDATVVAADSAMPSAGHSFIHTLALGPGGNDGHILGMTWAGTTSIYGAQIFLDTDPNDIMAIRSRSNAGVWTSWKTVIHSGTIGSQSVSYATSAGSATNATNSDNAGHLRTAYDGIVSSNPQQYFNNTIGLKAAMTGAWTVWSDTLWINGYSGGDVLQMCALHTMRNGSPRMAISVQASTATSYGTFYEVITGYNIASQSVSNADTVDGFHASVAGTANTIPTRNASGYLIPENWIQLNGAYGLYSPTNDAHLRPNTGSYGAWEMIGTKNGWSAIYFVNSGDYLMANASEVGHYQNGVGWKFRWYLGEMYISSGSTGGGTERTVIHSGSIGSQSVSYAATAGGVSWGNVSSKPSRWLNEPNLINDNAPDTAAESGFWQSYLGSGNPTGTWFNYINVRHSNTGNVHGYQLGMSYYDNNLWFRSYQGSGTYQTWSRALGTNTDPYPSNMNQYVRTTDDVTHNSTTSPLFLVNGHSDNTKGYRIHNTSGSSVSAMFTNSSNQLVIAAGAVDQINLNKKVYVNAVALGVNFAPSATAGRIDASNDIVAFNSSDERLKENITPIENALNKVKSLTGVEFDWKPEHKEAHGHEGRDTGIIAQQVLAVMPTAVRTNDTGYLAVRYEKLIGLLIEGMKEQQAQIDELKIKLDGLTK